MAIKDSTGVLQQVDAQVRRVNTILRQAAETFGVNSIQYRNRAQQIMACVGTEKDGVRYVNGVMQIKRTRHVLEAIRDTGYKKRALDRVESQTSIKGERKNILAAYEKRVTADLRAQIDAAKEAGQETADLESQLQKRLPDYVAPEVKGRERIKQRQQQINAAIQSQAAYYATLNDRLQEVLDLLYELESELGEYTQAHMEINRISRGLWTTEEDKLRMIEIANEELKATDHEIATEFEQGLSGTIWGISGSGLQ